MKLSEALKQFGFAHSSYDHSFFIKGKDKAVAWLLVYVDDIILTWNNGHMILDTKRELQRQFKIKDLGELKYFLGIKAARSHKGIILNQRKYALELISDLGLSGAKCVQTPQEKNTKFTSKDFDDKVGLCTPTFNRLCPQLGIL